MKQTLAGLRDSVVQEFVRAALKAYKRGARQRPCAQCAGMFRPRMSYHFLCSDACRRIWYRGVFRPRRNQ